MINLNTQLHDRVVDRAAMIRLYERRLTGNIEVILDGHKVRVDRLIREAKSSPQGLDRLRKAVDLELRKTYKETYKSSKKGLFDLATDQISYTYQMLESGLSRIWRTKRPLGRVAEEVLNSPLIENKTLAQGWAGVSLNEKKRLEIVIRKGLAEGKTMEQIALAVRSGNVHNISLNQSKALVITATTAVKTSIDHRVYKANEQALQGWQYVAVLDSRTSEICSHRDGAVYPVKDTSHLPPAHFRCRSTTVPVFKSWADIAKLENAAEVRRRNLEKLTDKQRAFYDGQTTLRETYNDWLKRQPGDVQLRHLGDYQKVKLFQAGDMELSGFTNDAGNEIGIGELRALSRRFSAAKQRLDTMQLPAISPDDFINNKRLTKTLQDYFLLQAGELDGTLSLTNYRGTLIGTKSATKRRVLNSPPTDNNRVFNPVTGRYEDNRLYQPNPRLLENNLRLTAESDLLLDVDKTYIKDFADSLRDKMSANEIAVVVDNLRINFGRQRKSGELWNNFKAVSQSQIKFDVMNVSDSLETQLRADANLFKKLSQANYIDPVLGPTQLDDLHDNFFKNIRAKNLWEDRTAPKIARELRSVFDYKIPLKIRGRLSEDSLKQFYLKFAHRLSLADSPDRDSFAIALGRDLHNLANYNGSKQEWYELGMSLLEAKNVKKFFELETFGVQKRRMKSKMSGAYFGPAYDTFSQNLRIVDERVQKYAQLTRKVDLGLRIPTDRNRLVIRKGYKTYFIDNGLLGLEDTRIPITSTSSFGDFPEKLVDQSLADALNWTSQSKYRIDPDFYDFTQKLLYFTDDKGRAKYFDDLNEYKHYIADRGDAYERFKTMEWLRRNGRAFSNNAFVDHRLRVYDRGLISPQSGESFLIRGFLQ